MKQPPHSSLPRIPFTKDAFEHMRSEVNRLQIERDATLERLKIAREQGDLSENGAYRYAKMELGNIARQLRRLAFLLRFGFVATTNTNSNIISFGSTVTLTTTTKQVTYMIVGEHEADPKQGKLSTSSPIGAAVLGKKVGDRISVRAPVGTIDYEITCIS